MSYKESALLEHEMTQNAIQFYANHDTGGG